MNPIKRADTILSAQKPWLTPPAALALGFFGIIALGAGLLMLPAAARDGRSVGWLAALFTATSATCVTGLTVVDTYSAYTTFGQLVIISLIQVGGLGFMMFATVMLVALGRRVSLHSRMLLRDSLSMPGLSGGVRSALRFVVLALVIEGIGAVLLSLRFIPAYGLGKGLYFGTFHAISAFCNAGFDLFGAAGSLSDYRSDTLVLMTISLLIVLGGLGFAVIWDVMGHLRRPRGLMLHTKIVLVVNTLLLLGGLVFIAAAEWENGLTLAREGAQPAEKVLNAWFQSVTLRTAGYYSMPQAALSDASKLMGSVWMFIGASPASTGGGIKTSTFFVVMAVLSSVAANREDINAFGKRIPSAIGRTAQSILIIYLGLLVVGALMLSLFESGKGYDLLDLVFEETSALGTVGLSAVGTANLRAPSKMWLIALMYFGRVGPLTMMLSFARSTTNPAGSIRYPQEQIIVG